MFKISCEKGCQTPENLELDKEDQKVVDTVLKNKN